MREQRHHASNVIGEMEWKFAECPYHIEACVVVPQIHIQRGKHPSPILPYELTVCKD